MPNRQETYTNTRISNRNYLKSEHIGAIIYTWTQTQTQDPHKWTKPCRTKCPILIPMLSAIVSHHHLTIHLCTLPHSVPHLPETNNNNNTGVLLTTWVSPFSDSIYTLHSLTIISGLIYSLLTLYKSSITHTLLVLEV